MEIRTEHCEQCVERERSDKPRPSHLIHAANSEQVALVKTAAFVFPKIMSHNTSIVW